MAKRIKTALILSDFFFSGKFSLCNLSLDGRRGGYVWCHQQATFLCAHSDRRSVMELLPSSLPSWLIVIAAACVTYVALLCVRAARVYALLSLDGQRRAHEADDDGAPAYPAMTDIPRDMTRFFVFQSACVIVFQSRVIRCDVLFSLSRHLH